MKATITIRDNVSTHLGVLEHNLRAATYNGITTCVTKSTDTMSLRVESAHTETGARRVAGLAPLYNERPAWWEGRGPGRIESGRMIGSIGWTLSEGGKSTKARAGFIHNAPSYLLLQELGTQRSGKHGLEGGGGRGIPPMLAYSAGKARFVALFQPTMDKELTVAVRSANRGRTVGRKV